MSSAVRSDIDKVLAVYNLISTYRPFTIVFENVSMSTAARFDIGIPYSFLYGLAWKVLVVTFFTLGSIGFFSLMVIHTECIELLYL
jgi:hypothetical protein